MIAPNRIGRSSSSRLPQAAKQQPQHRSRIMGLLLAGALAVAVVAQLVTPTGAYVVRQQVASASDASGGINGGGGGIGGCPTDRLVAYKVVMHTYWTRELFPKHYPDWRPVAQWTKTVGRAHTEDFSLYSLGQPASAALKQFAETGKSDGLEQRSATSDGVGVFDEFSVPAISTGAGRSEGRFFVDSNHTLVSLVTRIVPSPDWFVGVDSFQLCVGGSWIDSVTVELDPLDAGTDNGFTFTAPNWVTEPQGIVYRMTSHYPAHPAGSFYYPQNKRLPPIATFQFIKHKEFELSEVFRFAEDNRKYSTLQTDARLDAEHNSVDMNNELSADIELERQHEMAAAAQPVRLTEKDRIRARLLAKLNQSANLTTFSIDVADDDSPSDATNLVNSLSSPQAYIVPRNNRTAILAGIAQRYSTSAAAGARPAGIRRKHQHRRRPLRPGAVKDCRVGHWSEWSGCSRSCGIGEMQRHRKVIRNARRGGRACPPLQESKWCGSARDCAESVEHFKW